MELYYKITCFLYLAMLLALSTAQYYNPYNTPSPTFSSLNGGNPYYFTTPSPYYNYYSTPSNFNDYQIRIWPYVIGQYLYPSYYNNNQNNPYASLGTANWQTGYGNVYPNNLGKK